MCVWRFFFASPTLTKIVRPGFSPFKFVNRRFLVAGATGTALRVLTSMANTSYSGELPHVQPEHVPRRPVSFTANDASTTSPHPQRPQSSTTDDDTGARMSRGDEAGGGFRGRVTSFGSLPSAAGAGGLVRTWSYGGHASLDRAGEGGASMPTELLGTPIARAGYLPDLEPLIMGSRSGVFVGRSFSTPAMVNDPRAPVCHTALEPQTGRQGPKQVCYSHVLSLALHSRVAAAVAGAAAVRVALRACTRPSAGRWPQTAIASLASPAPKAPAVAVRGAEGARCGCLRRRRRSL